MTRYARLLLHVWIEVKCHYVRFKANDLYYEPAGAQDRVRASVKDVHDAVIQYRKTLKRWNCQLWRASFGSRFRIDLSDVEHLKSLARIFGPNGVSNIELGWIGHATSVGNELRYQYYETRMRAAWRSGPRKLPSAILLFSFGLTTGFGDCSGGPTV